ncbi:hypothetical protein [Streptomyces cupreus]|uniref:Uncharacterized protein n=1 Tax=Streptomyces cupreus TaxID=2759956 RepID=A0A7X1JAL9_9ACTN|nr:hypothetical protein [Streptomyces cupreus]MBC2907201.1 hypothetical protein [Streptomyces cupreus]
MYFFRLSLIPSLTDSLLYRGEVDGTHEVYVVLNEEARTVLPCDAHGRPVGPYPGFPTLSAHLLGQRKREGRPPLVITRYFA